MHYILIHLEGGEQSGWLEREHYVTGNGILTLSTRERKANTSHPL